MLCGLPRALLQVVHSNAVVWRNCQMRLCSTWRATVARTLSLEMVVLCGAKPQSCIPRLFRTGATSHRRRDRARWRRAFEGSPSPGCLESGSRTHTRPLIAELALMSHGPRMHLRFQGGSRGWRPGAAGSRAAFGNLEGARPSLPCGGERQFSPCLTASTEIASMRRLLVEAAAGDHSGEPKLSRNWTHQCC
jgi:hypothetical protein